MGKDSLDTSFGILFDSPILHTPLKNMGSSTSTPQETQVLTNNKSPNILNTPEFSLEKLSDNSKTHCRINTPINIKANKNLKHGFDDFILPKSSDSNQYSTTTKNVFNSLGVKVFNHMNEGSVKYFSDDTNSTRINLTDLTSNSNGFTKISLKNLKTENVVSFKNISGPQVSSVLKDVHNIKNIDNNGNSTIISQSTIIPKLELEDNSNDLHEGSNYFWLNY